METPRRKKNSALDARVEELLAGVSPEDRGRGRSPAEIATWLGFSVPLVYRLISDGRIRSAKLVGGERRGRGRSGLVRVTLADAARFRVSIETGAEHEVHAGEPKMPR